MGMFARMTRGGHTTSCSKLAEVSATSTHIFKSCSRAQGHGGQWTEHYLLKLTQQWWASLQALKGMCR